MDKAALRRQKQLQSQALPRVLRELYRNVHGIEISNAARKTISTTNANDKSLTYGEIVPQSFSQLLQSLHLPPGCTFVDLGSGTGIAVLCAALSPCAFASVWGIEIVPELASAADAAGQKLLSAQQTHCQETPVSILHPASAAPAATTALQQALVSILQNQSIPVDKAVSQVVALIGHRQYKLDMKGYKTFGKYLQRNAQTFCVENNVLSLVSKDNSDLSCDLLEADAVKAPDNIAVPTFSEFFASYCYLWPALPDILLQQGDIFAIDWYTNADVVYCSSLLFTNVMLQDLNNLVARMKSGAHFITLKPLLQNKGKPVNWKLVNESFYKMSWQMAKVYVYTIL